MVADLSENDLNVIMMFPGASRSVNDENNTENLNRFVEAYHWYYFYLKTTNYLFPFAPLCDKIGNKFLT